MARAKFTYSSTRAGYAAKWASIKVKAGKDDIGSLRFARMIIAGEARYRAVQATTGVPWYFIGALHMRESSCNFKGVLHNGEHIIGTGRKTTLVPAGRGPFNDWPSAADDALRLKGLQKYKGQWCPSLMGYVAELFNGIGYYNRGITSPYVFAGSNHEQTGKYIRDHVWDGNFDDPQIGTMTVLKRLCELRPDIEAEMKEPGMSTTTKVVAATSATAATAGGAAEYATDGGVTQIATDTATSSLDMIQQFMPFVFFVQQHGALIGSIFAGALVVGVVAYVIYRKRLD